MDNPLKLISQLLDGMQATYYIDHDSLDAPLQSRKTATGVKKEPCPVQNPVVSSRDTSLESLANSKEKGHNFDWKFLLGSLKPGTTTVLEKPKDFTMDDWQSLISAKCCLMYGAGKCTTHRIIDSFVPRIEVHYKWDKNQTPIIQTKKSRRDWDGVLFSGLEPGDHKDLMKPVGMTIGAWQSAIHQACRSRFYSFKTKRIKMFDKNGVLKDGVCVSLIHR